MFLFFILRFTPFVIIPYLNLLVNKPVAIYEQRLINIIKLYPQHFLNFFPEPQGQGSFLLTFLFILSIEPFSLSFSSKFLFDVSTNLRSLEH